MIRVTVWGENVHEQQDEAVRVVYPEGMHACIAAGLTTGEASEGIRARTATLDQPEHGLTEAVLEETDVLTWWGHRAHDRVEDAIVDRVQRRVLEGMGLIVLHSAHFSKIFRRLMGTPCSLCWREVGERERLWVCNPGHPIAAGVGSHVELEHEEMYGEPFAIPEPEETVFVSWFQGGEVFRSGVCYRRGAGRVFYFRPGHETHPTYHDPRIQRVLRNAVRWAAPTGERWVDACVNVPPEKARERIE
jgi:trehalose utilization protein